jgi:hypothetical protein
LVRLKLPPVGSFEMFHSETTGEEKWYVFYKIVKESEELSDVFHIEKDKRH